MMMLSTKKNSVIPCLEYLKLSVEFPGSCYCGGDKYCMCTPSLAIDAIIEVHSSRPDVGTNAQEGEGDWPMSRKSCLAIRGQIPHGENDLNGQDTVKSAPLVRAAKEAALKDQFSTGKTRALGDFNDISNKIPGNMPSSTALNRIHIESSQRLRRRRIQRGLNTRALTALNSTLESGSGLMGNKKDKKSGISIVLVFRRDPPSGFAIPGGVYESFQSYRVQDVIPVVYHCVFMSSVTITSAQDCQSSRQEFIDQHFPYRIRRSGREC